MQRDGSQKIQGGNRDYRVRETGGLNPPVPPPPPHFIPNRTFLVRFGGIPGEFGRAMVRILTRRSRAKIPMARVKKVGLPASRLRESAARKRRERAPKARGMLAKRVRASDVSRVTKIRKSRKRTFRKSMKKGAIKYLLYPNSS